ncbi:hypothetical protein [Caulobacter sp. Root1455]|uniref:hypothetical protein n=1 Tax=Caulobacter sp. Root1455 TaxID=1736465 RepID=UPI0012E3D298|nr:hypothetical protein [Caulobacter sp. Root1455]
MSAYNELVLTGDDGREIDIQFKLGLCWQRRYKLNEEIEFLEGQSGREGAFEVPGVSGGPGQWRFFALHVEDGRITAVRSIDETESDRLEAQAQTLGL